MTIIHKIGVVRLCMLMVVTADYAPVFKEKSIIHQVPEETEVGSSVLNLNSYVVDRDGDSANLNDVRSFTAVPQNYSKEMFRLDVDGIIYVNAHLDFDAGDGYFSMNVVVSDREQRKSSTTIYFVIVNINDNPPRFQFLGCRGDCMDRFYVTAVSGCTLGTVNHFTYGPINAIDLDNEPYRYKIVNASPHKAVHYVKVHPEVGSLSIVKHLKELDISMISFALQVHDLKTLKTADGGWGVLSEFTVLIIYISSTDC